MKEVTHLIRVQTTRWTAEEYEPRYRMHKGSVSRGTLLGRFHDTDRLAAREGAPTLVEAWGPIRGDPWYDRIYRDPEQHGGMVEVWCRAQPIAEVPGLDPTSLPWAAELVERQRVAATPAPEPAECPDPAHGAEAQLRLL